MEAVGPQTVDLKRMKICFISLLKSDQFVEGTVSQLIWLLSLENSCGSDSNMTHEDTSLMSAVNSEYSSKPHTDSKVDSL